MNIVLKIILYSVLGIVLIIIGYLIWLFLFYLQVPELEVSEDLSNNERIDKIDKWFQKLNEENKFNGGVLITKNNKPLLVKTYGFTNYKYSEKLNNNSSFRLASLSKQFTASGIMLLKERGQIEYEDLVSKHIPNFPYEKVTIRHLLNQVSGIPDNYMQLAEQEKANIKILTNEKAVELIIEKNEKQKFVPNEKFEYSNTNYILLARIIELVSKQSFEDYMKENIFKPLNMENSRVWNLVSKDTTFENKTEGFENITFKNKVRHKIEPTFIDGVAGDGAVFSSLNDFIIWNKFWCKNGLISDKNLKEAFKKPILNNGTKSNYGFGWVIVNDDIVMHNGAWLASNTYFVRNIKKKTSFVILDNSRNLFFHKIIEEIEKK